MASKVTPCACGCGETFLASHARRKYVDHRHEQRAYRERVAAAAKEAGLPASLSLAAASQGTYTRDPHGEPYSSRQRGQSAPRATTPVRRDTESGRVRVSLTLDEARALLDERDRGIHTSAALRRLLDKIAAGLARKT